MTYRRPKPTAKPDTLSLRLVISLVMVAAAILVQRYDPELLQPIREMLTANTGEVAEAFAQFGDSLGEGEAVVNAWSELQYALKALP